MPDPARRGTRIAHVGIAVHDLGSLRPLLHDILAMPIAELADSDGARIAGYEAGESLVELLESDAPDSPIARFIARRGPGIHHLCLAVDDLDSALERCRTAGISLIDEAPRIGAEGKRIAFLHPKSTAGILIELSEH